VRAAYQLDARQPFSARSRFRRALSLYRRAAALDPDPAIAVGEARAYAGLRLFGRAVRAQRGALGRAPRLAPLRARLVEYLEQDRRFAEAAVAAAALAAAAEFPEGPGLFMQIDVGGGRLEEEDANEPLSLGSERLLAVGLEVAPIGTPSGGRVGVVDLSFIPQFRAVEGLTGYHRWCPEWSRRRDLVLAGRPGDALDGMPDRFTDIRPGGGDDDCPVEASVAVPLLAGVAELEAGDRDAAVERLRSAGFDAEGRRPLVVLHDARQNLWRFAGDLGRAGAAAAAWTRVAPTSALAFDRPGEIAFLAEDYDRAASLFGVSLRLARSAAGTWSLREAEALLKRGTALEFAGRHAEALADLADSDEVASRVFAASSHEDEDPLAGTPAAYVSYNARLQAGDTHLRGRRYAAAREQYAAARERERDVADVAPGEPLRRPEVLDNNEALVQVQLGELGEALQAARRALQADPLSPIFLQNLGFTLYRLGRPEQAADAYRAAARADPTLFPAWNDLGVVLANEGRLAEAARAFRRAVGARSDYGLGWFNLGVALERLGPLHAPASQGAFGRAFRADPDLRGRARTFVADDHLYVTALDLSKPLPPRWEFARTQERAPLAVAGFALALLLGLQLGRTAAGPRLGGDARRWLELTRDFLGRLPRALVSTTAALAVAATVAVFLDPAAALA
jgi:tetratricopeptide (TPR) repeat protein